MIRNPRTARLLRLSGADARSTRLTAADRVFLRDLARVRLISSDTASKYHYARLKGGAERPLRRLAAAGLLVEKTLRIPQRGAVRTYEFASQEIARAWGGGVPITGAKRTDLHELVTAEIYFEIGRPSDFRLAADFSRDDVQQCGSCRPDAFFTDASGELVAVEADSGQYTWRQINHKQQLWSRFGIHKQIWGQPSFAAAKISGAGDIRSYSFF